MRKFEQAQLAFIGGGNMASALAGGLLAQAGAPRAIHVVDVDAQVLERWRERARSSATSPDSQLEGCPVWVFCVKPQYLKQAVLACKPFLQANTLVISVAAGVASHTLAHWLGSETQPWQRVVRCMPNTPALIGQGITALLALDGATRADRELAQALLETVGQTLWVESDAQIDAVTALSGSGPAYVFLFLQALIDGGMKLGLGAGQARQLALATVGGANQLVMQSSESLADLRERVTSRGGTTAAALAEFERQGFEQTVHQAMKAACDRAAALSREADQ